MVPRPLTEVKEAGGTMFADEDRKLVEAVRAGSTEAFANLYRRHRSAAYSVARQVTGPWADAEDLVAEAFAKILDLLRRGGGPDTAFRAYLFTTVRNLAIAAGSRESRLHLTAEPEGFCAPETRVEFVDPAEAEFDRELVARAFARLPRRWRTVLWQVEIEHRTTAEVSQRFGISRNSAAALAYRARKGLREAYWQVCAGEPSRRRLSTVGQLISQAA